MGREAVRETVAERDLRRLVETGVLEQHGLRAELIAGELVIRGAPRWRHQEVVARLGASLHDWARVHGGHVAVGPVGVQLDPQNSVQPDVVFVCAERAHLVAEDGLHGAPDFVIEVGSPGTTSIDLAEKRAIYERLGVPEYWVVDLRSDQVVVHRLGEHGYGPPQTHHGAAVLEPAAAPGLRRTVAELLDGRRYAADAHRPGPADPLP